MSTHNEKHRAVSRELVGGSKFIHALPRADRALVLASLMQEAPAKRESEVKCAFYSFRQALGKDDPFRARKIFERHRLGESGRAPEIRELVCAKISALNAEGKNERADSFAIIFLKDEAATERFKARIGETLRLAKHKMHYMGDYPFAYVLLNQVIEAESKVGLSIHTHEASLQLATHYLRAKDFEKALESITNALERGTLSAGEKGELMREVGDFLASVSDAHAREVSEMARKNGFVLSLCQEAISERISESVMNTRDVERLERDFSLAYSFQMHAKVAEFGGWLSKFLLEKADAEPENSYKDYLTAARIAGMAGAHDTMDECIFKFLALCEKLGKNDPSIYAEGSEAAREFSFWDQANSLGKAAFFGFLSAGEYEKAQKLAAGMAHGSSPVWEMEALLRRLEHAKRRLEGP